MIVLIGSLQKSGSLWLLRMVGDLVIEAGGSDLATIRERYRLGWFLRPTGHVSLLRFHRVAHLLLTQVWNETFVINTHAPPGWSVKLSIRAGAIAPIYVYRDPRDVARSLYEHGEDLRRRKINSSTTFDKLETMEAAIRFTATRLPQWKQWVETPGVHTVRYEDLLAHPAAELARICQILGLAVDDEDIAATVARHDRSRVDRSTMHFNRAEVGRWRRTMSDQQVRLCDELFTDFLVQMGYGAEVSPR